MVTNGSIEFGGKTQKLRKNSGLSAETKVIYGSIACILHFKINILLIKVFLPHSL